MAADAQNLFRCRTWLDRYEGLEGVGQVRVVNTDLTGRAREEALCVLIKTEERSELLAGSGSRPSGALVVDRGLVSDWEVRQAAEQRKIKRKGLTVRHRRLKKTNDADTAQEEKGTSMVQRPRR